MHLLLYAGIGFLAGFMSGMFGIGGGSVRIPLLHLAGLPLISSFGINLVVIPFSSMVGAFTHRRNIDLRTGCCMIPGGILGSLSGAFLAGAVSEKLLAIIFVIISLLTIPGIHLQRLAPRLARKIKPSCGKILSGTFLLNFVIGMRGGSGGALFPPFLKIMGLDIRKAIATSLFVTIFTALAGMFVYWERGDIPFLYAVVVLLGSILGARAGGKISLRTKPAWLEFLLSFLILILAFLVLFRAHLWN